MIRSTFGNTVRTAALTSMGMWSAIAGLASTGPASAAVPCEHAAETLRSAPTPQRVATALEIIAGRCQPLPAEILGAMKTKRWADRAPVLPEDRVTLVTAAVAEGYAEAVEISVSVLEKGAWGEGDPLDPASGARIIEGLAPALDPYRILLLLDVYEQVDVPAVRLAVLRTLRAGTGPECLLPALDAYWGGQGEIQVLAAEVIAAQPEKKADAVLTRVAKDLEKGAVLAWAARLAETHGVTAAVEAAKRN